MKDEPCPNDGSALPMDNRATAGRKWLGLAGLCVLVACSASGVVLEGTGGGGEPRGREEPGRLVIVGGSLADDNSDVYDAILSARRGPGPLCVLPTASGSPATSMAASVSRFDAHGGAGTAKGIDLTVEAAHAAFSDSVAGELRSCSGFFFTGGDQSRVVEVFRPGGADTPTYLALMDRYRRGAVVAGSSAGAAIMSEVMIAGGSSASALAGGVRREREGEGVWLRQGLGFLRDVVVDQHFLARGRVGRLVVVVLEGGGGALGLGVDENTALVVEGDSAWVVGRSGVLMVDARKATRGHGERTASGVRVSLLGRGDALRLESGWTAPAAGKSPLEVGEEAFHVAGDVFGPWEFIRLLYALAASPTREVAVQEEGYEMILSKAEDFSARRASGMGPGEVPAGLYAGPFTLHLTPPGL